MSQYELTFLLKKKEEEKDIKDLIASIKAKIIKEEAWGEKRLSYPIKKNYSAFFFNWLIEADEKTVLALRKKLNFEEKIIRYLLLKLKV
mgnify:CR=1 FL=1